MLVDPVETGTVVVPLVMIVEELVGARLAPAVAHMLPLAVAALRVDLAVAVLKRRGTIHQICQ